jgi:hypothetical protein
MSTDHHAPLPRKGERLGEGETKNPGSIDIALAAAPSPNLSPKGGEEYES